MNYSLRTVRAVNRLKVDFVLGKHAIITVRQPKGQLISIRSQSALYGTATPRELKVWNACDDVQDYVTVYDG